MDYVESILERLQRMAQKHPTVISPPSRVDYNAVLLAWSRSHHRNDAPSRCEQLVTELWSQYDATISSNVENSTKQRVQCNDDNDDGMNNLANKDEAIALRNNLYCPSPATYRSALQAMARSGTGRHGAERAEALLEEMERRSRQDVMLSHLRPTTACVNLVLYVGYFFARKIMGWLTAGTFFRFHLYSLSPCSSFFFFLII